MQIVSAIFGGYDKAKPAREQSIDCTWTLVTDEPGIRAPGWNVVTVPSKPLADKWPKLRPWEFSDQGPWIWIDGSVEVMSPDFASEACTATQAPLSQWEHPQRDCIYREAKACAQFRKGDPDQLFAQVDQYRSDGHPEHWGLWAAGVIVYRERLDEFAAAWETEIQRWTRRDQLSEPVVLRRLGLRPDSLPKRIEANPWLRIHPHRRGSL